MGYQFFYPKVSKLITRKLVFIEVGDGNENSGSFFIHTPQIAVDDSTATFTCWKIDRTVPNSVAEKSFELELSGINGMTIENERSVFNAEISSITFTELLYSDSHEWRQPNVGEKVRVSVEKPFTDSITKLGLQIGSGNQSEIIRLRELANTAAF